MDVLFLSGCAFGDTGGAQRPPQLARAMARAGHWVGYHNRLEPVCRRVDGVEILDERTAHACRADLVVCAFAEYSPIAFAALDRGARLIYDLLDDWDAFVDSHDIHASGVSTEAELARRAEAATCSAPRLVERAARLGARRTALVRNGGTGRMLPRARAEDGGLIRAVFSGYLFGSWLAWDMLEAVAGAPGIELVVIGACDTEPDWARPGMFVGELPHDEALALMATCDVGLVPFRGRLCASVDPIKYYDYLSTGLWVVSTPDVEPLLGRPYVVPGHTPSNFVESVRQAAQFRRKRPIDPDFVAGSSWDRRAEEMLAAVACEAAVTEKPPAGLAVDACRLRVTWEAPATCNMRPPCPYCNNRHDRVGRSALSRPRGWWIERFAQLAAERGPLYLSACYGEPMSDADAVAVLAHVAQRNKVDISTNLVAPMGAFAPLPRNGNVGLATSFHPHAWPSFEAFVAKRRQVESSGLRCGIVSVVAWPPYVERLPGWMAQARCAGLTLDVLPFHGVHDGRIYPDGYSAYEWDVIGGERALPTLRETRGLACRTGAEYVFVAWDGTMRRCFHPDAEPLGSLIAGDWQLPAGATPCPAVRCTCPDMWRYVEEGVADAVGR